LGVGGETGVAAGEDPGGEGKFGEADAVEEPGAAEGDGGDEVGVIDGGEELEPEAFMEPDRGEGEAGDQEIVIRTQVRTPTRDGQKALAAPAGAGDLEKEVQHGFSRMKRVVKGVRRCSRFRVRPG
jgi:hypothetical protein